MNSTNIQPRKTLDVIQPYSPGKPIWEVQKELGLDRVIKMASNENPLGPSPKAVKAIQESLADLNRYPDADASVLREAIAEQYAVKKQQVITTNGADELITLISEAFLDNGDEIIVPSPSFSEYDFGAHIMGAVVKKVPFDQGFQYNIENLLKEVTAKTRIIYICSPNNPTGTYISKKQMEQLLAKLNKDILVVFDGAYSQFAEEEDYTDGLEFINQGHPIIALQTFSKIYGIAGVRVGFGIAPESIIKSILKVKEPFNVNTLAQIAATAAIKDSEHVAASFNANKKGKSYLYTSFEKLGLSYTETTANFILVQVGENGEEVYRQLMAKGVIVRYGKAWGLPEHIRVTVGTEEENEIFIKALTEILSPLK